MGHGFQGNTSQRQSSTWTLQAQSYRNPSMVDDYWKNSSGLWHEVIPQPRILEGVGVEAIHLHSRISPSFFCVASANLFILTPSERAQRGYLFGDIFVFQLCCRVLVQ